MLIFAVFFTAALLLFLQIVFWISLRQATKSTPKNSLEEWPYISVLLAVRNEEAVILNCLHALAALDYPKDKIEILIGNDASEDRSADIIQDFIRDKAQFKLYDIAPPQGHLLGKANVLAQLAAQAQGVFCFVTDADIEVPNTWISAMLSVVSVHTGICTGFTFIKGEKLLAQLQALDWAQALATMAVFAHWGRPVTAMGNNMLFRREAYEAVGGYEALPASIVEDFTLFEAIRQKGYTCKQLISPAACATSTPISSYSALLQQRKRWMRGARQASWPLKAFLALQLFFYPAVLIGILFWPWAAFCIGLGKIVLQNLLMWHSLKQAGQRVTWQAYWLYEPYLLCTSFLLLGFYSLPFATVWKGRKY